MDEELINYYKDTGIFPRLCYGCNDYVDKLYKNEDDTLPNDLCQECVKPFLK